MNPVPTNQHTYQLLDGTTLNVQEKPLGRGGEGEVFEVLQPVQFTNHVVKIYHLPERTPEREAKLKYMIAHPPESVEDALSAIWPIAIIYQQGQFVGFIMRKARGKYDLTILNSLKIPSRLEEAWGQKYGRHKSNNIMNRLRLCYNIAYVIDKLHQSNRYVLVDIKPENIKISLNGFVSLIDLDSLEIVDNQSLLYPAQKLSGEYSPPEIQKLDFRREIITETWDRFSMAIVFYKVLLGVHPFATTGKGDLQNLVSLEQKIHAGLFVHGSKAPFLKVIPFPHQNYAAFSQNLRGLFYRCFDAGLEDPSVRPTTKEWLEGLSEGRIDPKKYKNPFAIHRKVKQSLEKHLYPVNGGNYMGTDNPAPWLFLLGLQMFNIFEMPEISIPFAVLMMASGLYVWKKPLSIELDRDKKTLIIKFRNLLKQEITRKYRLERLEAQVEGTYNFFKASENKILKIYKINKIFGTRQPILSVKLDKNTQDPEIVKNMLRSLERFGLM